MLIGTLYKLTCELNSLGPGLYYPSLYRSHHMATKKTVKLYWFILDAKENLVQCATSRTTARNWVRFQDNGEKYTIVHGSIKLAMTPAQNK